MLKTRLGSRLGAGAGLCLPAVLAGSVGLSLPAAAENVFVTSSAPIDAKPSEGRRPTTGKATREEGAITIGDVLFSGQLIAGGVYNDNLYNSRFNKTSDVGGTLIPSLRFERSVGLHTTTLRAAGNAQFYFNNSNANVYTGTISLSHIYEVQRDLIVFVQGNIGHNLNPNAPPLTLGTNAQLKPGYYNEEYFSGSVEKSFDKISVGVGASILGQQYQNTSDTLGNRYTYRNADGTSTMVTGRIGYALTPVLQAFVQPTANWQSFDTGIYDSHGYTITAGLRSDRIGLFRGEVYAGYAHQTYENLHVDRSGPTFGGSIYWYPTRDWTFTASLSQSYGLSPGVAFQGGAGRTTSANLSAAYAVTRTLSANGFLGYSQVSYPAATSGGRQDLYSAGLNLNYLLTSHLGVYAGYTFTRVEYAAGDYGYDRNLVTLGASGRF